MNYEQTYTLREHLKKFQKISIFSLLWLVLLFFLSPPVISFLISFYELTIITINPIETFYIMSLFSFSVWTLTSIPTFALVLLKYANYTIRSFLLPLFVGYTSFSVMLTYGTKYLLTILSSSTFGIASYTAESVISVALMISFIVCFISQIIFILPILHKLSLFNANAFRRNRLTIYCLFPIISSIITPSDIYSSLIVLALMILSFEIGLLGCKENTKCLE